MDLLKVAEQAFAGEKKEFPAFKAGDQITVGYRIKEGNKERVQEFRGDVICIHVRALQSTSTVKYVVRNCITSASVRVRKPAFKSAELSKKRGSPLFL